MYECSGIFGKLFGHKFESKIIKSDPKSIIKLRDGTSNQYVKFQYVKLIDADSTKDYKIICTRCGEGDKNG